MEKIVKQYSAVVVLSPEIIENQKGKLTFKHNNGHISYSIDNDPHEFRFKAVKRLYKDGVCKNFILVGGVVKKWVGDKKKNTLIDGKPVPKKDVMRQRLECSEYGIPRKNLLDVESMSNTKGNAMAVLEYLAKFNAPYINNIGLLTNFYHLPRAMKIFIEKAGLRLIPICAESIVYGENYEELKKFYKEIVVSNDEKITRILADDVGDGSEIKGMWDMESGKY